MADLDVTKKLSVYHVIYRLNLSFANVVRRCRELQETRIFRREFLRVYEGYAQELQAEVNFELLETLHELEVTTGIATARFGRSRKKSCAIPTTSLSTPNTAARSCNGRGRSRRTYTRRH